jgi:hypothetical protein
VRIGRLISLLPNAPKPTSQVAWVPLIPLTLYGIELEQSIYLVLVLNGSNIQEAVIQD